MRRELIALASTHGFVLLADEVYGDLAYDGPTPPMARLDTDAPVISFGSLSKAYLAPGWRAGWMAVGSEPAPRRDVLAAILQAGRRPPLRHRADAVRHHGRAHAATGRTRWRFRQALRERADADRRAAERHPGHVVRGARRRVLRDAQGRSAAGPHRRGLRAGAAARQPACCACTAPGSARSPKTASSAWCSSRRPPSLAAIYDTMAEFTAEYLER